MFSEFPLGSVLIVTACAVMVMLFQHFSSTPAPMSGKALEITFCGISNGSPFC